MRIDWESDESHVLLNPRLHSIVRDRLLEVLPTGGTFSSHLWLMTSGSTGGVDEYKCVALSKQAVLASARAVNAHLSSGAMDVWLNPLPAFHVGGLGIMARGHLSGARVVNLPGKWDADYFYQTMTSSKTTLTALVPTQLHDLIDRNLRAPECLRCVVVGGGRLEEFLCQRAKALKWPVLPSYGLTEAASQVATASHKADDLALDILEHVQVRIDDNGYIALKGPSLLTAYAYVKSGKNVNFVDPKIAGWLTTEDRGALKSGKLEVLGRGADFIKIGGESVDLSRLERLLEKLKDVSRSKQSTTLLALPDQRLGHVIHLAIEGEMRDETTTALEQYQQAVLPFEKFRHIHSIKEFPRSELGKTKKITLISMLSRSLSLPQQDK